MKDLAEFKPHKDRSSCSLGEASGRLLLAVDAASIGRFIAKRRGR